MGYRLRRAGQLLSTLNSPEKEKGPRHSMHSAIRPQKAFELIETISALLTMG
jgi:hypothetical protein